MELIHPESHKCIEVREDQVALYISQGWKPFEAPAHLEVVGEPGLEYFVPPSDEPTDA